MEIVYRFKVRFGFDLCEKEEQVACHVSALALAMIDEARRDAEM